MFACGVSTVLAEHSPELPFYFITHGFFDKRDTGPCLSRKVRRILVTSLVLRAFRVPQVPLLTGDLASPASYAS